MDIFGNTDPRKMPGHFFSGSIDKDYSTAVRANISKQNYTVCPRHWYFNVSFVCEDCKRDFVWSAQEQKLWFEEYGHFVDAQATRCKNCRFRRRRVKKLKNEYDQIIGDARQSGSSETKKQVIGIVNTIESLGFHIPDRMRESRDLFHKQLFG